MRGARSHLGGGDNTPSVCLAGRKMEWRYKPAKTLFTPHPFPCWISLLPLSKPDRPETLETTVSSRCAPFLVFSEGLEGLLEKRNKVVCPWRVTLIEHPSVSRRLCFKGGASEWLSRYSPWVITELSQTNSLKHNHLRWETPSFPTTSSATNNILQEKKHSRGRKYCTYSTCVIMRKKCLQMVLSQQHLLEKVWSFSFVIPVWCISIRRKWHAVNQYTQWTAAKEGTEINTITTKQISSSL